MRRRWHSSRCTATRRRRERGRSMPSCCCLALKAQRAPRIRRLGWNLPRNPRLGFLDAGAGRARGSLARRGSPESGRSVAACERGRNPAAVGDGSVGPCWWPCRGASFPMGNRRAFLARWLREDRREINVEGTGTLRSDADGAPMSFGVWVLDRIRDPLSAPAMEVHPLVALVTYRLARHGWRATITRGRRRFSVMSHRSMEARRGAERGPGPGPGPGPTRSVFFRVCRRR